MFQDTQKSYERRNGRKSVLHTFFWSRSLVSRNFFIHTAIEKELINPFHPKISKWQLIISNFWLKFGIAFIRKWIKHTSHMIKIKILISKFLWFEKPSIDDRKTKMIRFTCIILKCYEIGRSRMIIEKYSSCKDDSIDRSSIYTNICIMIFRKILLSPDIVCFPFMMNLGLFIYCEKVF